MRTIRMPEHIKVFLSADQLTELEDVFVGKETELRKELADLMVSCFHRISGQTLEEYKQSKKTQVT